MEKRIVAVSYSRVSSRKQVQSEGLTIKGSLEKQRSDAERICVEQGWQYAGDYREAGRSGELEPEITSDETVENRPELLRLLQDARRGEFQVLIIRHADRLARLQHVYLDLCYTLEVEYRVQLYNCAKPYPISDPVKFDPRRDNRRVFERGFEAMQGQMEQNDRLKKVDDGRRNQIVAGRFISPKPPFGYRIDYRPRPNSTMVERVPVPDEKDFPTVQKIFQMAFDGYTPGVILDYLTKHNFKTRHGKEWKKTMLIEILDNPFYAGILRYGYRKSASHGTGTSGLMVKNKDKTTIVYGKHNYETVVSEEDFEYIQSLRRERATSFTGLHTGKNLNPLVGILKCGHCYSPVNIVKVMARRKKTDRYRRSYFRCQLHLENHSFCRPHYVLVAAVMARVCNIFDEKALQEAQDPGLYYSSFSVENYNNKLDALSERVAQARKKISQLDNRLRNLVDALADETITKTVFSETSGRYTTEKDDLQKQIESSLSEFAELKEKMEETQREREFLREWRRVSNYARTVPLEDWTPDAFHEIQMIFQSRLKALYMTGEYNKIKKDWEINIQTIMKD
jgi:site-specific DNA recombinase